MERMTEKGAAGYFVRPINGDVTMIYAPGKEVPQRYEDRIIDRLRLGPGTYAPAYDTELKSQKEDAKRDDRCMVVKGERMKYGIYGLCRMLLERSM